MKIKHNSLKILSLAITLMMVLSVASIPAMAAELSSGAYANNIVEVTTNPSTDTLTFEKFKAAFAAAKYTVFEDFEDESSANDSNIVETTADVDSATKGAASIHANTVVSGVEGETSFKLRFRDSGGTKNLFLFNGTPTAPFSSGTRAVYKKATSNTVNFVVGQNECNVMNVTNEKKEEYKITTFAFVLRYVSAREQTRITVTYDDGSCCDYSADQPSSKDDNIFFSFKAPQGKYISEVAIGLIDAKNSFAIDDVAIIFENVNEPKITLSTDEAAISIISELADVTDDVYVNVPAADEFSDKKVLLALYGEGEKLLDVAVANEGVKQAMAEVPENETLTSIKAFVWDFANGLIPVQAPIEINE